MSESRVAPDASAAEAGRAFRAPTRSLRRPSLATALGIATAIGLALALAAVYHAPETRTEPLQPDSRLWRILLGVGVLGCFVTYVLGLAALRRRAVALTAVIGVAVAIQLAPLATPLLISRDTYLYWAYGREAVIHHANPYDVFPDRFASDPAYRLSSSSWARLRDPYGPSWTLIGEADARLAGSSGAAATGFYRVLAAAAMLACVGLVAWTRRSAFATALVGWNPLLAIHFAGGGHNDALMLAFVAVGLALGERRPRSAGAAWVVAASIKATAVAFLGVEFVYRLREHNRRWFTGLVLGGALALAIATALYGVGWARSAGPISNMLRDSQNRSVPGQIANLGVGIHTVQIVAGALFVVLYLWVLREAWHGRRRTSLAAGGLCLALTWLEAWYVSWPIVLAAFDADAAGTAIGLVLTGYALLDIPGLGFTL